MTAPPVIARHVEIHVGTTFVFAGRPLTVVQVHGLDPAAPVIVQEHVDGFGWLKGQYALWSADGVVRAMMQGGK